MRSIHTILIMLLVTIPLVGMKQEMQPTKPKRDATSNPESHMPQTAVVQMNMCSNRNGYECEKARQAAQSESKHFMTNGEIVISGITFCYAVVAFFTYLAIKHQGDIAESVDRAWIMVDLKWTESSIVHGNTRFVVSRHGTLATTTVLVHIICTNFGKTPAWITEKRIGFSIVKTIPVKPDLRRCTFVISDPEYLAAGKDSTTESLGPGAKGTLSPEDGNTGLVYGTVKYRDIFGRIRYTYFGYLISASGRKLIRLPNFPEYNKNK